ncbi:MAG: glycosyltransferase family 2 protein [archaeon]
MKQAKQPSIAVIITTWNYPEIDRCLLSLKKEQKDYKNLKVIVVDNASKQNEAKRIRKKFNVETIRNKENYGFAKGNNIGIRYALKKFKPDYLFLLNDDTEVRSNAIKKMVEFAEQNESAGIIGCKLIYPDNRIQHAGGWIKPYGMGHYGNRETDKRQYDKTREVDYVTGAAFLIKREVINRIGLLDEAFSPYFREEVDFCFRAKKAGYKIFYYPQSTIVHYTSMSIRRRVRAYTFFVFERTRLRLALLNFPVSWLIPFEIASLAFIFVSKRDENMKLGIGNLAFNWDFPVKLAISLWAHLFTLIKLPEILSKRFDRTKKIWY